MKRNKTPAWFSYKQGKQNKFYLLSDAALISFTIKMCWIHKTKDEVILETAHKASHGSCR